MFQRIHEYELIDAAGLWYRPRAYADLRLDGTWEGWLVFFPLAGGRAIAPAGPETTQSTLAALNVWATGLTPVYLEGALARALRLTLQVPILDRLAAAEYEALDDAARLELAAEVQRTAADVDDAAADAARIEAEQIRRDRLVTEGALAATEEAAATAEATLHGEAAREARAIAADAGVRRRSADAKVAPRKPATRRGSKKK
jgi:hypothetical protein